ncbi:MAG: hypothetical protein ABIQ18_09005 [Umezawaea sp.]
MTDDSLVAPVESSREVWTGSSLADSTEGLVDAIKTEGWVDDSLAGAGLGVEIAATVMDPISALPANGLGWAMEYFEPLREMLDELTGKPDVVSSHAATWNNMATELSAMSTDLRNHLDNDLPSWTGEAADSYQGLVEFTREIVRDLIADLVARVIVWAVEAIFVVTIPVIASQIAAAIVKWAGRILTYVTALITSLTNLSKLLND